MIPLGVSCEHVPTSGVPNLSTTDLRRLRQPHRAGARRRGPCRSLPGPRPRRRQLHSEAVVVRSTRRQGVAVDLPEEVVDDLRQRLRRIGGQIQGNERMLEEGRECRDLVTQISAANRALERTGFRLVSAGMEYCISNPDKAEAEGYPIDEVEKMFLRLA